MEREIAHLAAACSLRAFPCLVFASPYLELGDVDPAPEDAAREPPVSDSDGVCVPVAVMPVEAAVPAPPPPPESATTAEAIQVRRPTISHGALTATQQDYAMLREVRSALASQAGSTLLRRV